MFVASLTGRYLSGWTGGEYIFDSIGSDDLGFDEPSRFPSVDYDLSLVIPEGKRFDSISDCWTKEDMPELRNVSVIDIYELAGVKSITVRFSFCLNDRTLTSEEVAARIDSILANLNREGITLKS